MVFLVTTSGAIPPSFHQDSFWKTKVAPENEISWKNDFSKLSGGACLQIPLDFAVPPKLSILPAPLATTYTYVPLSTAAI